MRVLFVSHQAEFLYGGETATLAIMNGLRARGVEVHFASPSGIYYDAAANAADRSHLLSSVQFSRKVHLLPRLLPALWKTKRELKAIVAREKIDVVHATSLKAMVYCWRLRKRGFPPIVWHHHDIMPLTSRNNLWLQSIAKAAALILVPSRASQAALEDAGLGTRIEVVYQGYEPSEWQPKAFISKTPFVVGMVGEISHRKASDLLPAILKCLETRLGKAAWEVKIQVAGEGLSDPGFAEQVSQICAPYASDGRIEFLGRVSPIREAYRKFDVLIAPSRQEAFGLVVLEAMFAGIPVIGAPVGGLTELIAEGETGFFASEPDAITERIIAYKKDFSLLERHGQAARMLAEKKFSLTATINAVDGLYKSLLRKNG